LTDPSGRTMALGRLSL